MTTADRTPHPWSLADSSTTDALAPDRERARRHALRHPAVGRRERRPESAA
ncbi:hypothetical protein OG401_13440 [Kitasatospora purpeofusca]|uniref:hypothetical protein n=1 Tax=Kitasatospora purpeofusca TaxID=67352 RepID=UPI002255BB27|nr:hypothetical protein [Kitasatospora purpeofusca]MCX4685306.1 hypothetical protein [Kitasatospora purpeofusca]